MMAGPAVLEYGYNAAVWAAPYVKSTTIKTYNAVQYYGSSEIIKSIHKYGKLKNNIGMLLTHGFGSVENDVILGGFYGVFMYVLSPDAPEISINPIFDISNKLAQIILYYAQLITEPK